MSFHHSKGATRLPWHHHLHCHDAFDYCIYCTFDINTNVFDGRNLTTETNFVQVPHTFALYSTT